jgi:hypothetical protein
MLIGGSIEQTVATNHQFGQVNLSVLKNVAISHGERCGF